MRLSSIATIFTGILGLTAGAPTARPTGRVLNPLQVGSLPEHRRLTELVLQDSNVADCGQNRSHFDNTTVPLLGGSGFGVNEAQCKENGDVSISKIASGSESVDSITSNQCSNEQKAALQELETRNNDINDNGCGPRTALDCTVRTDDSDPSCQLTVYMGPDGDKPATQLNIYTIDQYNNQFLPYFSVFQNPPIFY